VRGVTVQTPLLHGVVLELVPRHLLCEALVTAGT
jgi:hypothetical protein